MKNLELTPKVIARLTQCFMDDSFIMYDSIHSILFESFLEQNDLEYEYSEWTENLEKGLFAHCYTLKDIKAAKYLRSLDESGSQELKP